MPRILVTHHPMFALPVGDGPELGKAIGRQELALDAIADAGVDILLAGHNHRASTHNAADLVTRAGPALVIQAGTATSVRLRDEEQSFNRIEVERRRGRGDRAWLGRQRLRRRRAGGLSPRPAIIGRKRARPRAEELSDTPAA